MNGIITRKFFKPIKGKGELRKFGRHFAQVSYLLQGWQDFKDSEMPADGEEPDRRRLSGMDGEITLGQEDRQRFGAEEIVGQEFSLHIEKDEQYEILVYKLKDDHPSQGRYSVRCKLPGPG